MANTKKLIQAAAGAAGGAGLNVEDVFSTYLYDGNASTNTITNGIDLSNEGGLVWCKRRDASSSHALYDTERGASGTDALISNTTDAEVTGSMSSFNNNGFTLDSNSRSNASGDDMASWTFRKAPKFFDVQTWSGNSTSGRAIPHNLGTTPGMIIVKWYDGTQNWAVWHKDLTAGTFLLLNESNAVVTNSNVFTTTSPTDSVFYVGSDYATNGTSANYVAYLFAHNDGDGEFGPDGDADIIKCGSYTGGSGNTEIDLGFEPQWLMIKRTDSAEDWLMLDVMRGLIVSGDDVASTGQKDIMANTSAAEATPSYAGVSPQPNGFKVRSGLDALYSANGGTYIYIAIRRGPMAVPESATDVFAMDVGDGTSSPNFISNFPVDASLLGTRSLSDKWYLASRLTDTEYLRPNLTNAAGSAPRYGDFDMMDAWWDGALPSEYQAWMWRRAPNFFDVVTYTGSSTAGTLTVNHNLAVKPELIIAKARTAAQHWNVLFDFTSTGEKYFANIGTSAAAASGAEVTYGSGLLNSEPTDSAFVVRTDTGIGRAQDYIAYLFASLDGVSKVGSYTGNGSTQTIGCGFSSGARFILIKRTDSTGDWYVWDTERGIVAGNDPHLSLNTTAAEVTTDDSIDPVSSGFAVNQVSATNINVSSATYIFLAIS